jgi:hypothetical protein
MLTSLIVITFSPNNCESFFWTSNWVTTLKYEGFEGRSFNTEEQINNFRRFGFNDRASSAVVERDWWEVCEDALFGGCCAVLRPGR